MALSLAGLVASLSGCEKAPVNEDTRHLENPPPKPPNCPDLPELKNITLKDGTIADVRIVKFDGTKLYFPKDIVKSAFVDKKRYSGFVDARYLREFAPDIHFEECPGVVHEWLDDGNSTFPLIHVSPKSLQVDRPLAKNLRFTNGLSRIVFTTHVDPEPSRALVLRSFFRDIFVWESKLVIMIRGRKEDEGYWKDSRSLDEFVEWLSVPPIDRNNDAIFTPKVDSK